MSHPVTTCKGKDVASQSGLLLISGWALALFLDNLRGHTFPTMFAITLFGSFTSYAYSAPPLKLKANGWQGTYVLGVCYTALPWWAGQALFGKLTLEVTQMLRSMLRVAWFHTIPSAFH